MKFYSGFSLENDKIFFENLLNDSQYNVAGFSYGAIKALRYTKEQLQKSKRIDTLQLFSPAFFQTKSLKFKKIQTIAFKKNQQEYLNTFKKKCFFPYNICKTEHKEVSYKELEDLLYYEWSIAELLEITLQGVKIEVYLGSKDNIIDIKNAKDFFINIATVTSIKNGNHFLKTSS